MENPQSDNNNDCQVTSPRPPPRKRSLTAGNRSESLSKLQKMDKDVSGVPSSQKDNKKRVTNAELQESVNSLKSEMHTAIAESIAKAMQEWQDKWALEVSQKVTEAVKDVKEEIAGLHKDVESIRAHSTINEDVMKRIEKLETNQATNNNGTSDNDAMNSISERITKLEEMTNKHEQLEKCVLQQQKYIESLENIRRAKNMVAYGVTEGDMEHINADGETASLQNDIDKIRYVLTLLEKGDTNIVSTTRLGKTDATTTGRPRPILVTLDTTNDRNSVLSAARKLKDGPPTVKKIFLKKDLHPAIRREYDRLKKAEKEEREKAENQGRDVKYNSDNRTITIDGVVVDTFNPQYF